MKKKDKISIVVHDLSSNPIVRAFPIALALQKLGYEVEVLGFLIKGNEVFKPYATKFEYKTINLKNAGIFEYLKGLPKLLRLIKGDIIYTCKPRMTSYFIGLLKSNFGLSKPLFLDAEDDELYYKYKSNWDFLYNFFLRGWNAPNSHKNLLLLHLLLFPTKGRTVVSTKLQKRYGGEILLHGPDEKIFNPDLFNKDEARKKFNIPTDKIVLVFAGVPHDHKGILMIIEALKDSKDDRFIFVGAGPEDHPNFQKAKEILQDRCILLGSIDNKEMPDLLIASDIVPILQQKTKFTESQMPAKLFEAMAMKIIIIATDASDIGLVLGKDEPDALKRGFVISFNDISKLKETLQLIAGNSEMIERYTENAYAHFVENASVRAISKVLQKVLVHS